MTRSTTRRATRTARLPNGIRVAAVARADVDVTSVVVSVGVGTRDEPVGRSGFAHLFEHLMFAGTAQRGPGGYERRIEELGGRFNASTRADGTLFVSVVPTDSYRDVLALEADRFAHLVVDDADLRREVAVVTEEVAARFHRRPLPGFPMAHLRERMFGRFANRHDGASDTDDLTTASLADVHRFFRTEYAPARLTVVVVGDVDVDAAVADVEDLFGPLPGRPAGPARPLDEPVAGVGRHVLERAGGRADAVALGYRTPDPADLDAYLPVVLLAEVLGTRLAGDRAAGVLSQAVGADLFGDPLGVRDPNGLVVRALVRPGAAADAADAAQRVVSDAGGGPREVEAAEVSAAAAVLTARLASGWDDVAAQAVWVATRLWCTGHVDLDALIGGLRSGRAEQVRAAAAGLGGPCRIELVAPAGPR